MAGTIFSCKSLTLSSALEPIMDNHHPIPDHVDMSRGVSPNTSSTIFMSTAAEQLLIGTF